MSQERYLCIHGHFYQPPRENPWLESVELQDSAYPFHDWNERITAECYAPNAASRILDPEGRIIDIVNNYSKISFNFGPTLLWWLERYRPEVYQAILEADRLSRRRYSGHGSAIAQVFNHMIMPLAHRRDKITQVVWGIEDFRRRFRRRPEGMWLPETAVDLETLEILAQHGIRFTILAPRQARRVRPLRSPHWEVVEGGRIDPTRPYLCRLPSKRTIALFFYDGPISQEVAFDHLLENGERFAHRLLSGFQEGRDWPQLVHIATDGETYGHHRRFGDMALAYCLYYIESNHLARLTNYGEYLAKHPPTHEVEIVECTSWSCAHGVERWRADCGCRIGVHPHWTQAWRSPLREAMDWLRDHLARIFEKEGGRYLVDPWEARNDYHGSVVFRRDPQKVEDFLARHARKPLTREEKVRVLGLLEMQRNGLLMYTSCGWFFDEISGIETTQVLQYAARAIQLAEAITGESLETGYLQILERAPSNLLGNGARVYETLVRPAQVDLERVGAHYAISSLFEEYPEKVEIFCYKGQNPVYERREAGRIKLATGRTRIISQVTWYEKALLFAVLHLGDQNITCGILEDKGDALYRPIRDDLWEAFDRGDIAEVIRRLDRHFQGHIYSVRHLFKDEQRKILDQVLQMTLEDIEAVYRQIYENHYTVMNFLRDLGIPLPRPLAVPLEYVTNLDIRKALISPEVDLDRLETLVQEIRKWNLEIDRSMLEYLAGQRIKEALTALAQSPQDASLLHRAHRLLHLLGSLPLNLDLWEAQNIYFTLGRHHYPWMEQRAREGNTQAQEWVQIFRQIGEALRVRVA